jgi:hypothetical protein
MVGRLISPPLRRGTACASNAEAEGSHLPVERWLKARRRRRTISSPCQALLAGAGKHSPGARKIRKVGKVLGVKTCPRFLNFVSFLAFRPQKKAAG